jgi:hypothetical protein
MKTKIAYRTLYYCVYPENCKGWTPDREFTGRFALDRLTRYLEVNRREGGEKLKVIRLTEEELTTEEVRDLELVDSSDPRLATTRKTAKKNHKKATENEDYEDDRPSMLKWVMENR